MRTSPRLCRVTAALAGLGALLGAAIAPAGVVLSADVYETPGMAGYWTYDLTATADDGYLNGFDFTNVNRLGRGIFGSLHHGGELGSPTFGFIDPIFGGSTGSRADTHWLVSESDVLSIGAGQSSGSLTTASVFWGSSAQRDVHRSLPFARVVTSDPASVTLDGQFMVSQRWSDGGTGESVLHDVRLSLGEIGVGAPPSLGSFPDRPLPPPRPEPPVVVAPPPVLPPVLPPAVDPTTSRVVLSAEAIDTPGLPGYRTYTVTATAIDGYLNAFDFTNFAGGTRGISGPLHHGTPSLENLFADRLFASGPADPADSQWLVSLDDGLAIGTEQSTGGLEAAYAFTGTGGRRDTFRTLPLAQLVTNDPSAVLLSGEFSLADAWSDGSVAESWLSHLVAVSATLSDLVGVTPPELGSFPDRPAPPPPVVVERPAVEIQPPLVETVREVSDRLAGRRGGDRSREGSGGTTDPSPVEGAAAEAPVIDLFPPIVEEPTFIDPAVIEPAVVEVPLDLPAAERSRVILVTEGGAVSEGLEAIVPPTDWLNRNWIYCDCAPLVGGSGVEYFYALSDADASALTRDDLGRALIPEPGALVLLAVALGGVCLGFRARC